MSTGEAFLQMHREIMLLKAEKDGATVYNTKMLTLVRCWMLRAVGEDAVERLAKHSIYPMSPEEADEILGKA